MYSFNGNKLSFSELIFIAIPFTIFIGFIFFYRGFDIGYFSFWIFYPVLLVYLLFICGLPSFYQFVFKMKAFNPSIINITPIICLLLIFFTLHILWNPDKFNVLMRFWFEVIGNLGTVLIGFWMVKKYGLDFFCHVLLISSVVVVIFFLILFYELETIRRIGAADTDVAVAVNHVGHSLAIASICGIHQIIKFLKRKKYVISIIITAWSSLLLITMFLTGSRAALFGIVVSICVGIIYLYNNIKYMFNKKSVITLIFVMLLMICYLVFDNYERILTLLNRFAFDRIWLTAINRLEIYSYAMTSAGEWAILFGEPWRYGAIQNVDPIPYPHNMFLSIILHFGFAISLLFIGFIYLTMKAVIVSSSISQLDKWMLLSCISTVLIYVSTSGRLTRVITIFLILGICWGMKRLNIKQNQLLKINNK